MQFLADSFGKGTIIDWILVAVVFEALALILLRHFFNRGPVISDWLPNLVSGMALMVALRFALVQSDWVLIAMALSLALVAHLADLFWRIRRGVKVTG